MKKAAAKFQRVIVCMRILFMLAALVAGAACSRQVDQDRPADAEEPTLTESLPTSQQPVIPPPPRLQVDLSVGSPDLAWWRESMKSRDERIRWWQEARFGCFIHWNASSLLAGEWKGEVYMGYAEHIQRMARINQKEYIEEVISKFNPVKFDADEWARVIKDAGMRYVVITAKHHDGFAMWDSEVSDYNIVDATPFGRDPMAELNAACDRHGLVFGVYYSHAFDWGEEKGVGNDWEWENPGGNRGLHGGLRWFDQHPERVPYHREYVDEKSIPQILELIEKYDPQLIWFDTASKLPLEETLRILRAVREASPDIVVNSRVTFQGTVDFRDNHFGDYKSTGDRAVIFRHTEGPWETCPTTNESYGYHQHDKSHKTPDFLIEVLAKAVAKGGNILLNMGPMGNGKIDPVDVAIFRGIGDWMDVNAASIRQADRTTLHVQPWGESTLDGNRFYLHVFEWPEDKKIQIGGLKTGITGAYMLADAGKTALAHQRLDAETLELTLGGDPPEVGHAVVVMEVEDATNVGGHRLLAADRPNELHGFDSRILGKGYEFGDGKVRRDYIAGWNGENQKLVWDVYLRAAATFQLSVEYERIGEPGDFVVTCGDQRFQSATRGAENDEWFSDYVMNEMGLLKLPAGKHRLEFSAVGQPEGKLLRFRALHLKPE
jgi:alpha-L-fucosidase